MRLAPLLLGLLLGGMFLPARVGAQLDAAKVESPSAPAKRELRFSKHALARMKGRKVSEEQVRRIVATLPPFQYFHQGRWKTGFYDEKSDIFVATNDGIVITVIAHATPHYVADLKRKKP